MADPAETLLSPRELRDQLTSGLNKMSGAEAHEEFSERLDNFLEQNGIEESEIISGESEYAPILSEAAFNGLDFQGMEGTGLSLSDARRVITDDDYRLEMAEDYLTGNAEDRIENEYTEYTFNPNSRLGLPRAEPMSAEGMEAIDEAVKIKEFMHYEMRDALNAGKEGFPATLEDFDAAEDRDDWMEMPEDQSALHQNGGEVDRKFIHEDGRELVFDGDDPHKLMTAGDKVDENGITYNNDQFMGTYNYVNATIPIDKTPGPHEVIGNILTEGSLQHKALDVEPWVELGNTRADRHAHGGAEARQELLTDSAVNAGFKSLGNIGDFQEKAQALSDAKEWVSDKADQAGDAINDRLEELRSSLGAGSWQEGALNPNHQSMNAAHIQQASVSEIETPTASGTVSMVDAIGMLAADQKILNTSSADGQLSPIQDALNHPNAAQMFQNLQSHGVKTLTAEITPDMSTEDRVRELLLAGQEATQEAGIAMPTEQRELEATQEFNNSYEDDYSLSV